MPLIRSFPRAILHIDGDSFFASCEVVKNPALKGKPVVTGKERGICSSMSYEARALGVRRAMRLSEIRKLIPDVIILPSDYETYSLYSERMYEIVRRYTPEIEEYSIDECFADLTGMRRVNHMSYEDMAIRIQRELVTELGMTFSVGLSVNKVMAKVASKWKKPDGLTIIPGRDVHHYLAKLQVGKIWGIGPNTEVLIRKLLGVPWEEHNSVMALHFAQKNFEWVQENFSKPFQEIWHELNGSFIYPLTIGQKHDYASISKTKTFTPPSKDKSYIYSQLSKNVENACIKMRRHELFTKKFAFFLKTQDFKYYGLEIKLSQAVQAPQEIMNAISRKFGNVFRPNVQFRATEIVLMDLVRDQERTMDLFGQGIQIDKVHEVLHAVDKLDRRYGKHTVFLASSSKAMTSKNHRGDRGEESERRAQLLKGESSRRRIGIPFLGKVI
jgi:nucleotidyltransferase/DNA polymerase involved in DNA repair